VVEKDLGLGLGFVFGEICFGVVGVTHSLSYFLLLVPALRVIDYVQICSSFLILSANKKIYTTN
jgi:hypothetical protein